MQLRQGGNINKAITVGIDGGLNRCAAICNEGGAPDFIGFVSTKEAVAIAVIVGVPDGRVLGCQAKVPGTQGFACSQIPAFLHSRAGISAISCQFPGARGTGWPIINPIGVLAA